VLLQAFRIDSDIVRLDGGGFMPRCSARRLLAHIRACARRVCGAWMLAVKNSM
jgi:hypothetical protein